jgi:hypothetical protein
MNDIRNLSAKPPMNVGKEPNHAGHVLIVPRTNAIRQVEHGLATPVGCELRSSPDNVSTVGRQDARERFEQCGLSRTVRPDEGNHLVTVRLKRDIRERVLIRIPFA